jgi:hypothetical protein
MKKSVFEMRIQAHEAKAKQMLRNAKKRRGDKQGVITCVSQRKVRMVRSAIVQACLEMGAKDDAEVRQMVADAMAGVVKYNVAAVKAHRKMGTYSGHEPFLGWGDPR